MKLQSIVIPAEQMGDFCHVSSSLTLPYLEGVLSKFDERAVAIRDCKVRSLCAHNWGGVSNSGATVMGLSVTTDAGDLEIVVKVLSPDALNLFKVDRRFAARRFETNLMGWLSRQNLRQTPIVYDVRCDVEAREFWIIEEYFPQIGWGDNPASQGKQFGNDLADLKKVMEHVAALHAYTHTHLEDLKAGLDCGDGAAADSGSLEKVLPKIGAFLGDAQFMAQLELAGPQVALLRRCVQALEERPAWVDETDMVCVNSDFSPDNLAFRKNACQDEMVSLDWGVAHVGTLEEEFRVLLPRLSSVGDDARGALVEHYLKTYGEKTGHVQDSVMFYRRIPWAALRVMLRYIADHMDSLRWVKWQTRSKFLIQRFVEESEFYLGQIH